MDLRRIRQFSVLAETLNFSRAAERLHIAQPALSVSIQKLETELGTRLFERTSTGVQLTAGGQAVLIEARRLLYHGEQVVRIARDATLGVGGRLRIGFVGTAIHRLLPRLVPAFRSQYPEVELVLRELVSARIVEMLAEDALDIGIVRTPLMQPTAATLVTLQRDRFVAALPIGHPLARREPLHLAELRNQPFIMYAALEAAGLHGAAMTACQSVGFVPEVAQEATQVQTVIALVESGLGVALVPEVVRGHRSEQVAYRDLADLSHESPTTLALAFVEDPQSPASERFVAVARATSAPD